MCPDPEGASRGRLAASKGSRFVGQSLPRRFLQLARNLSKAGCQTVSLGPSADCPEIAGNQRKKTFGPRPIAATRAQAAPLGSGRLLALESASAHRRSLARSRATEKYYGKRRACNRAAPAVCNQVPPPGRPSSNSRACGRSSARRDESPPRTLHDPRH